MLHYDGVNMTLDVVHCDQWKTVHKRDGLGVRNTYQQRADQAGPFGYRDGGELIEARACLFHRIAHYRGDRPQVLA